MPILLTFLTILYKKIEIYDKNKIYYNAKSEEVKRMKKYIFFVLVMLFSIVSNVFAAAPITQHTTLRYGQEYATSDVVGISKTGYFYYKNTAGPATYLTGQSFCAWDGWPYTVESQYVIRGSQSKRWTEKQSKLSNFKIVLWDSSKKAIGNRTVSLNSI